MAAVSTLLYVPNIIGYFRLLLIAFCWLYYDDVTIFLPSYITQMLLDGIDGCLARRLGQCSTFGAWLDVLADNIGRTVLWTRIHHAGVLVSCLEWTVFVCTHNIGPNWKDTRLELPLFVKKVMSNGFYTPLGAYVIAGLHVLPLCLYGYIHHYKLPYVSQWNCMILLVPSIVLVPGRIIGMGAELSYILVHIKAMLISDELTSERSSPTATDKDISPNSLKVTPQPSSLANQNT